MTQSERWTHLEGAHEGLVHRHHAARVIELAAVVGGGEESHELPLGEELITVLHHLQTPTSARVT